MQFLSLGRMIRIDPWKYTGFAAVNCGIASLRTFCSDIATPDCEQPLATCYKH